MAAPSREVCARGRRGAGPRGTLCAEQRLVDGVAGERAEARRPIDRAERPEQRADGGAGRLKDKCRHGCAVIPGKPKRAGDPPPPARRQRCGRHRCAAARRGRSASTALRAWTKRSGAVRMPTCLAGRCGRQRKRRMSPGSGGRRGARGRWRRPACSQRSAARARPSRWRRRPAFPAPRRRARARRRAPGRGSRSRRAFSERLVAVGRAEPAAREHDDELPVDRAASRSFDQRPAVVDACGRRRSHRRNRCRACAETRGN